jgi:RNA recognition motif-containing protein
MENLVERSVKQMSKRIYVGNLSFKLTEEDVRNLFSEFGEVQDVHLVKDRETGRLRGFGFVEMDEEGAQQAISALDGTENGGRELKVSEAKERQPR